MCRKIATWRVFVTHIACQNRMRATRFELARAPGSHPSLPHGFQGRCVYRFRHARVVGRFIPTRCSAWVRLKGSPLEKMALQSLCLGVAKVFLADSCSQGYPQRFASRGGWSNLGKVKKKQARTGPAPATLRIDGDWKDALRGMLRTDVLGSGDSPPPKRKRSKRRAA